MRRQGFRILIRLCRSFALAAWFTITTGGSVHDDADRVEDAAVSAATADSCFSPLARIKTAELPNAVWIHEHLLSGSQPDRVTGFSALRDLGIQTIISVDGIIPDVQGAREHGLRYVHLPIGYDDVPAHRMHELARAMLDLPRPIYIHCHHGKHRGPAAAAAGCITAGVISRACGIQVLHRAGTAPGYRGLWNSVRSARRADAQELAAVNVDYSETIEPSPLVDAMNRLEARMEHVELLVKQRLNSNSPDLHVGTKHHALLLREQFTELERLGPVLNRPRDFQILLAESRRQAAVLGSLLQPSAEEHVSALHQPRLETAIRTIRSQCDNCHRRFRD